MVGRQHVVGDDYNIYIICYFHLFKRAK